MKAIKFTISSEFAIFKNSDIRNGKGKHFTYNHIHRISILGILGSIIGLEGYNIHKLRKDLGVSTPFFPEFYNVLKDIKVSIIPNVEYDSFSKQIHGFTDTSNFSNEDGVLMVQEQWLRDPSWDIYVLLDQSVDSVIENKLVEFLLNQKTVYIPYVGKNDHPAIINNTELIYLTTNKGTNRIDSIFKLTENVEETIKEQKEDGMNYFLFEFMPVSLDEEVGNYVFEKLVYTDACLNVESYYDELLKKNIIFI